MDIHLLSVYDATVLDSSVGPGTRFDVLCPVFYKAGI